MQSQETRLDKARLSNYLVIRRLSGKSYQATLQYPSWLPFQRHCQDSFVTFQRGGGMDVQKLV